MLQPPTPTEIRAFRETHGLTQKLLAEKLGISVRTVEDWLSEKRTPLPYLTRALRDLARELKRKK